MEKLREELLAVIAPVVERFAVELIDLELKGGKSHLLLRVIVDVNGGVLIDTCAALSRALADELDTKDVISSRYRLEVSSPGVDRPLRTLRDFQRNFGRAVRIRYRQADAVMEIEGMIHAVSETEIELAGEVNHQTIAFANLEFGKLKLKW
ncbi:MAG: ribosome maturation factor RimP [candidate division KSB1 bacterium]